MAVDVGTTYIKCHLYDHHGAVVGKAQTRVELQYPSSGAVETDPENLWRQFVKVVKEAIKGDETAYISPSFSQH